MKVLLTAAIVLFTTFFLFRIYDTVKEVTMQSERMEAFYSVVMITGYKNGVPSGGSGVVILSKDKTYILTARHVVTDLEDAKVTLYPEEKEYPLHIVSIGAHSDLALVTIDTWHEYVAKLSPGFILEPFTPVFKVGIGALGEMNAEVGIVSKPDDGTGNTLVTTASSYFGDSGGGVFSYLNGNMYLVGITYAIHRNAGHVNFAVNTFAIQEFLANGI